MAPDFVLAIRGDERNISAGGVAHRSFIPNKLALRA
jgi:hypothetical protein